MDDIKQSTTEPANPTTTHVRADLLIGVGLLGVAIVGKVAWSLSDGGLLAALSAR
ncbi:hypothetical protein [Aeromicrobium sp.]|uniref:hypothetical protein n=1 Tax=Aeromicrobium sp. TaxID=1871063 RepID=UPI003C66B75D